MTQNTNQEYVITRINAQTGKKEYWEGGYDFTYDPEYYKTMTKKQAEYNVGMWWSFFEDCTIEPLNPSTPQP